MSAEFFEPENEESFLKGIDRIQEEEIQFRLRSGCKVLTRDYDRNSLADQMLQILFLSDNFDFQKIIKLLLAWHIK